MRQASIFEGHGKEKGVISHLREGSAGEIRILSQRVQHHTTPEKRLLAAILADAHDAYRKACRNRNRTQMEELEAWVSSDDDGFFSFEGICGVFSLDVEAARSRFDTIRRSACGLRLVKGSSSTTNSVS